jgi:hypothetical protein
LLCDDDETNRPRRLFFANACKNGLAYICRLWQALEQEVVQSGFGRLRTKPFVTDESHRPAAIKLLALLLPADPSNRSTWTS